MRLDVAEGAWQVLAPAQRSSTTSRSPSGGTPCPGIAVRAATAVTTSTSPRRRCRAWESLTRAAGWPPYLRQNALYLPAHVVMSLACGATVKSPRRMSASTTWACWPQQHTTPAAYDAHRAALASVAAPPPGTSSSIPDPGLDAAHAVDEEQCLGSEAIGIRVNRPPSVCWQFYVDVHHGGGFF